MGINIYIQSASDPKSICRHLHAFEPAHQDWPSVTPSNISDLIRRAKASGWHPNEAGDFYSEGWSLDSDSLTVKSITLDDEEKANFLRKYNSKFVPRHNK